ncbi:UDP-N-acetylmuramoyl-L-alanine--D-glutamate ligase [Methylibium sp. Pch-M]|uniref:UDP-N-acetylmuramoyl-L-alanine--D-glutamate ligase n=1 Tax=Methylibium sp. Pch-M TaxID=2082386 RepID=UPI00101202AF|nr:UDP-N-acetylmuramoyl-L-alanine--D-glutamate ligase [Methylibium sp. Pch-M]QAZ39982.1 UDP-N-acetylmuramoyl-L-alanine--D-glutamate ligase [Methylibium sp. Pch-M]
MKPLEHQTVLVLGLGDSGLAMAQWCARQGAAVRVADSREAPPQAAALAQALPGATLHHGFDADLLDGVQRVLKSPGLSPLDPALAPLLARAAELGVPVEGELDLFAQALAGLKAERGYAPKVIAITGTNGKTTTTVMCGLLVERSGLRVAVAGNVGPTMLGTLAAALEQEGEPECPSPQPSPALAGEGDEPPPPSPAPVGEGRGEGSSPDAPPDDDAPLQLAPPPPAAPVFEHLPEAWVLELSSFQLDGVRGFVPDAAVVLNITQDHLDWHGSMPAYAAAKARIYGPADAWGCTMVVNRDDVQVEALVPAPLPQKGRFAKPLARKVVRFGLDAPQRPGDYGLVVENGMAWLVRALEADETIKRRKGDTEDEEIHLQRLMPADALRIRGRHNAANALAALALATAVGRPLAPMLHGLREYGGEPHRVEFIATVGGVEAYDDSKGTNVGATVAALEGLGADKAPAKLVVILGGDGKGQDFAPLVAPVARHARAVALIGRDAPTIEAVLGTGSVPLARHDTLQAATRWCFEQARAGDAVLLSPACASLDMFRNYAQRAEVFCDTVRELACEHGETA